MRLHVSGDLGCKPKGWGVVGVTCQSLGFRVKSWTLSHTSISSRLQGTSYPNSGASHGNDIGLL